jgi:hypothetical protein
MKDFSPGVLAPLPSAAGGMLVAPAPGGRGRDDEILTPATFDDFAHQVQSA